MTALFLRTRDALVALIVGSVITFGLNIWSSIVVTPENIDRYFWLANLQEPGGNVGEKLAWRLYPIVGYPWCVRVAVPFGYAVLVTLWTGVVWVVVMFGRLTIRRKDARH